MIGWLAEWTLQGAAVLLVTRLLLAVLRGRTASSLRHAAWSAALALALLLVPLALLPTLLRVPVGLPALEREAGEGPRDGRPVRAVPLDGSMSPAASPIALAPAALAPAACGLWLLGAVLLLARSVRARRALGALRRASRPVTDPHVRAQAEAIRAWLGLTRPVELLEHDSVSVPVAFGTLRPAILLPSGAGRWSAERLRVVFAHELAHVRRGDAWTQLVAEVARALHWHDPLAWHAWSRLLVERERACDDEVVVFGTNAFDYAGHLLALAAVPGRRTAAHAPTAAALSLSELAGLEARIRALLAPGGRRGRLGRRGRGFVTVPALVLVLAFTLLGGARPAPPRVAAEVPRPARTATGAPVAPGPGRTNVVEEKPSPSVMPAHDRRSVDGSTAPAGETALLVPAGDDPLLDPRSEHVDVENPRSRWPTDVEIDRAPERDRILVLRAAAGHVKQFEHDYVGERAEWALTRVRDGRITAPLVESLADPDGRIQAYAAWSLAAIGAREAAPAIRPLLDHANWRVRAQAASALLSLDGTLPDDRLDRLAADPAWQVRMCVVEALAGSGGAGTRARLLAMRNDPHFGTRQAVEDALARQGIE